MGYVEPNQHTNIEQQVKTSAIRKKWKTPIIEDSRFGSPGKQAVKEEYHQLHNKFKTDPNVYKFNLREEYIGMYDGLDEQFWKGFKSHDCGRRVICFIEEALSHYGDNTDIYDKAYRMPEEVENYINNDKVFRYSGVHPNDLVVFDLKLVGAKPTIKPIAVQNNANFIKKQSQMQKQNWADTAWDRT